MNNSNLIERKEQSNKGIGYKYLWWRFTEYIFKISSLTMLLFKKDQSKIYIFISSVLTFIGLNAGNIGNAYQYYQGKKDQELAINNFEHYKNTDKLKFAIIAKMRGGFNIIADTTAAIGLVSGNALIITISNIHSIFTDILGLIKNVRDVAKWNGLKCLAFVFCAISRFPFIISSVLNTFGILDKNNKYNEPEWETRIRYVSLSAMVLFNTGALIRQKLYLDNYNARMSPELLDMDSLSPEDFRSNECSNRLVAV